MITRLLARWVVAIVVLPLIAAAIRWLSRSLEERSGPTRTSTLLRHAADALRPQPAGPAGRAGRRW